MIKALFIDFSGVLTDSMEALFNVYAAFMRERGLDPTRSEFEKLKRPALQQAVAYLKKRYAIDEELDELIGRYIAILEDYYRHKLEPLPGAREFIVAAHGSGIQVALVTEVHEALVKGFLMRQQFSSSVAFVVTPKSGEKGRPAPDLYKKGLSLCRASADEALAIEREQNGLLAARNAGIEAWKFDDWGNVTRRFIEKLEAC